MKNCRKVAICFLIICSVLCSTIILNEKKITEIKSAEIIPRDILEKQAEDYIGYSWGEDEIIIENVITTGDLKTVVDSNNNTHILHLGIIGSTFGLYHKILFSSNLTWSGEEFLGTVDVENYGSSMDVIADSKGDLHLAYQVDGYIYYRKYSDNHWFSHELLNQGRRPKIEMGLDDVPRVIFARTYSSTYTRGFLYFILNDSRTSINFFTEFRTSSYHFDFTISERNNEEIIDFYACRYYPIWGDGSYESYEHLFYHTSKSNVSSEFSTINIFRTFSSPYISNYIANEGVMVADNASNLHLFFSLPTETTNRIYHIQRTETGWQNPTSIGEISSDNPNARTYITAKSEPYVKTTIVWSWITKIGGVSVGQNRLRTYHPNSGWSEIDLLQEEPVYSKYPSLAFTEKGDAHLCWWDKTDNNNTIQYRFGYGDGDGDGLLNKDEESIHGTDPADPDCDDDQMTDGEEIANGFDPWDADQDSDGMLDGWEFHNDLNPLLDDANDDLDLDLLLNIEEYAENTLPNNNDTDTDGADDFEEIMTYHTDPNNADSDTDGILDGIEIHQLSSNPNSIDSDNDTMDDFYEYYYNLDINVNDTDGDPDLDGLLNIYEYENNISPQNPDHEGDGLNDYDEVMVYFTNPIKFDTDEDSLWDGIEVHTYGTSPTLKDTDDDSLNDNIEITNGIDPLDNDTDNDLMLDGYEWFSGLDPLNSSDADLDFDKDGLTNLEEFYLLTDPFNEDTDDDDIPDLQELVEGTSPISDDTDGDLLDDYLELYVLKTNPTSNDTDLDGLNDYLEHRIYLTNPLIMDSDMDGLLDGEEVYTYHTSPTNVDTDGEGLQDKEEIELGTNPLLVDTDSDEMDDFWEVKYELNPLFFDAEEDAEGDGVTNIREYLESTNPRSNDTDLDNLSDFEEIFTYKTSPTLSDTDRDGLNDYQEIMIYLTNPFDTDSDDDKIQDGEEILIGTNPLIADTDGDGIIDGQELRDGTDPLNSRDNKLLKIRNFVIIIVSSGTGFLLVYYLGPRLFIRKKLRKEV